MTTDGGHVHDPKPVPQHPHADLEARLRAVEAALATHTHTQPPAPTPTPVPTPTPPPVTPPVPGQLFDCYLVLPDKSARLAGIPEYAIRTANLNTWDAARGWNNLGHRIGVGTTPGVEVTRSYTEDVDAHPLNPERGMFFQEEQRDGASSFTPLTVAHLAQRRSLGHTLMRRTYNLRAFRGLTTVPASYRDAMEQEFANAREARIKLIVRFVYDYNGDADNNPPAARIIQHIESLRDLVQRNSDTIAALEPGFIGKWGEHHGASHLRNEWWGNDWSDRLPIMQAIGENFTTVQLPNRYPRHTEFYSTRLPQHIVNRLGFCNDFAFGGSDEGGTFSESSFPGGRAWITNFVHRKGRAVGGEHVFDNDSDATLISRFAYFDAQDWSYLNSGFDARTLDVWKRTPYPGGGTYYDRLVRRLGYRFVLRSAVLPDRIVPGAKFNVQITLDNVGYAAPFNARDVQFVMRDAASGVVQTHTLPVDIKALAGGPVVINAQLGG